MVKGFAEGFCGFFHDSVLWNLLGFFGAMVATIMAAMAILGLVVAVYKCLKEGA